MVTLFRVVLIATLILIFIKKKDAINKLLEKKVILNLLLFAVSLFIKNERKKESSLKLKFSRFLSEKLLFLDLWILNYRSDKKSEKLFIKDEKKNPKGPNC